jgi:hypothetical protein
MSQVALHCAEATSLHSGGLGAIGYNVQEWKMETLRSFAAVLSRCIAPSQNSSREFAPFMLSVVTL